MPQISIQARAMRVNWLYTFIIFCFVLIIVLLYNPYSILAHFGGPSIIITVIVTIVLASLAFAGNSAFLSQSNAGNMGKFFASLVIGAVLLVLLFWSLGVINNSWSLGPLVVNCLIIAIALVIIYKMSTAGNFGGQNAFVQFVFNVLFYIPCGISAIYSTIYKAIYGTNLGKLTIDYLTYVPCYFVPASKEIWLLILAEAVLITVWAVWPLTARAFLTRGGQLLIDQPIPLNSAYTVATYETLNGVPAADETMKENYNYALSCWFYLDATPISSNTYKKIIAFGNTPVVEYNSRLNKLRISVGKNETGQRIVYETGDILLQRWTNLVFNCQGGTVDIFVNGVLARSAIEVVSYQRFDPLVVGEENGVLGKIANIMYYRHTLPGIKITELWREFEHSSPPVMPRHSLFTI